MSDEQRQQVALRVDAVVADSRVMSALARLMAAPLLAGRGSQSRHLLAAFVETDRLGRTGAIGWTVVVAVMTHVAVSAWLRVPVHALGWTVRLAVVVAGVLLARRPHVFAAAWQNKIDSPR